MLLPFSVAHAAAPSTTSVASADITRLSAGAPTNMGKKMGPLNYIKVETRKLTKAKVVWVNWDYLRKAGFDVGNEEMTPQLEKAIVDAFGWGVRAPDEPADAFSKTEKKTFYADRYGGDGLAGNMGSGRAASAGQIQIKGIGKTDLVTTIGPSHSNGTAEMEEAIREALLGEVGQVLPFGANRVIAILDRGTTKTFESGYVQNNALIVREDSVRPAHYMKNLWGRGPLMESEDARTKEVLTYLRRAFPVPSTLKNATDSAQIRGAVLAYADRIAEQFAAAYALKIYHGATSVSNIEVTGRFIDYGTTTTLPDYGKVKMIEINDAMGDTNEFREILMLEFLQNIRANLPKALAADLPSDEEMGDHFLESYKRYHHREFLRLTGLPKNEILKIEALPESWKLTDLMERVATDGAKSVLDPHDSAALTKYNLNRIIVKMAAVNSLDAKSLEGAIKDEMGASGDTALRRDLIRSYLAVMSKTSADRGAMLTQAQNLNAERPLGFRWTMYKTASDMMKAYKKTGDAKAISQPLNQVIHEFRTPAKTVLSCGELFGG